MSSTSRIVDYLRVYSEHLIIDGTLYKRYIIHDGKPIGIPKGICFYRRGESLKYAMLSDTPKSKGMYIRYNSKATQVSALLTLIEAKSKQLDIDKVPDTEPNKQFITKHGTVIDLPIGICVMTPCINNTEYYRVAVGVFNPDTKKFKSVHLHGGKADDDTRLLKVINKAIQLRNDGMKHYISVTQINAPRAV